MQDDLTERVEEVRRALDQLLATRVVSDEPVAAVTAAAQVQRLGDAVLDAAVAKAREAGVTWQQVGTALGVSRQAAFQRFREAGSTAELAPLPHAAELATQVVGHLQEREWPAIMAMGTPEVAGELNQQVLAAAWDQVAGQCGPLQSTGEVTMRRLGPMTITETPLKFRDATFTARISFTDAGQLAGLFLLPAEMASGA